MSIVKFTVNKDHFDDTDYQSVAIDYQIDESADFVYIAGSKIKCFHELIKEQSFNITKKSKYSKTDEYINNSLYKCEIPYFDYSTQKVTSRKTIFGKDLSDLVHQIEIEIAYNFITWNEKYLASFNILEKKVSFKNELETNLFLIELYKKDFTIEDYWYEKHRLIFSKDKLIILEKIKKSIEQVDVDLFDMPELPKIEDIIPPRISFFDKLFFNEKSILAEFDNKIAKLNEKIDKITSRNRSYEKVNNLYLEKKQEFIKIIDKYIEDISKDINIDFKNIILKYEEGLNNIYFTKSILDNSCLSSIYDFEYSLDEIQENHHVICDFSIPNDNKISNVKSFKEYKKDLRIEPIYYSERDFKKVYNSIIYSITFRLVREIFASDYSCQIKQLTLNGWVNALNKKNGKYENKCILSLSISRGQFQDIDFSNIDLVEAFKHLKGVSASSLIDFIPVAPIVSLNMNDKRFIQSEEILHKLNDSTNIAAMDWEEFEHLIRELFEKEFAVNGGEVKVTQSSRDGGVDAIAFDPDPIRGGKIIIQSKRYTNVVGISAIRDLYGTVLNEGATKGIIVTTSHYGNDAYDFAKGKPITLLDGNNLLYLLEKHGYKAKIDIDAAKLLQKN